MCEFCFSWFKFWFSIFLLYGLWLPSLSLISSWRWSLRAFICLGIQNSNLYMRARKVKEVSLAVHFHSKGQAVYHIEYQKFQYHNITSLSSPSVWEWYGGWISEMILFLQSCPCYTALSYTPLLYSILQCLWNFVLNPSS